ncbi:MAG: S53 family peptidase [Ktedonobacteraceae bacterium]
MKQLFRPKGLIAVALTLVILLSAAVGGFFLHNAGTTHAAAPQIKSHLITVHPQYTKTSTNPNNKVLFQCQDNAAPVRCYGPSQIRNAYDISRVINGGIRGQGTTIVIIDAFRSPTIRQDLHIFDKTFGLPDPTLNIIAPDGLSPFNPADPNQVGWSGEITLDVEWAHAIAPAATIDLVLARDNQDVNLLSVTKYAVDNNLGDVLSQSFGEAEACMDPGLLSLEHTTYQEAAKKGITVFASSGDQGAAQLTCDGTTYTLSASTPASDPLVVAVGGTYLNADAHTGKYIGESAWNDSFGATGGGFSTIYSRPGYQSCCVKSSLGRGVPDVAYNADVNGGVLTYWGEAPTGAGFYIFGGTSAGSPQWAAMLALVDSAFGRQGDIHSILYNGFAKTAYSLFFHDVTVGNNTFTGAGSNGVTVTIPGYNTRVGWDAVDGLGSFDLGNTIFGPASVKAAAPHLWKHS